jgi:mycofactocin precursor
MDKLAVAPAPESAVPADAAVPEEEDGLIEEDLLVEDVSIDGMCGVY